jgi:hypothetical protein
MVCSFTIGKRLTFPVQLTPPTKLCEFPHDRAYHHNLYLNRDYVELLPVGLITINHPKVDMVLLPVGFITKHHNCVGRINYMELYWDYYPIGLTPPTTVKSGFTRNYSLLGIVTQRDYNLNLRIYEELLPMGFISHLSFWALQPLHHFQEVGSRSAFTLDNFTTHRSVALPTMTD